MLHCSQQPSCATSLDAHPQIMLNKICCICTVFGYTERENYDIYRKIGGPGDNYAKKNKSEEDKYSLWFILIFFTSSIESRFKYMFEWNEIKVERRLWGGEFKRMEEGRESNSMHVTKAEVETVWGRKRTTKERKEVKNGKKKGRILGTEAESPVFPWTAWKQLEFGYFSLSNHAHADSDWWEIRAHTSLEAPMKASGS